MQPEIPSLSSDPHREPDTLILGDGTGPGLVMVRRSLLQQICETQGAVSPNQQLGLLLGPEPQGDDLVVEQSIPLGSEYRFARSVAMLVDAVKSIEPVLADARQQRSHVILGLYRILPPGREKTFETGLEFLLPARPDDPLLSKARCCFVFVPLAASETCVRALVRNGERWENIQEIVLRSESSSLQPSAPPLPPMLPQSAEPPPPMANAAFASTSYSTWNRLWIDATVGVLLLLLVVANVVLISAVTRLPSERADLQPLTDQISELRAEVSALRHAASDFHLATSPPPPPFSESRLADSTPTRPKASPINPKPAEADVKARKISNPAAIANTFAIGLRPTVLKPLDAFQFKVNGDPAPEVVWSAEGPGSIDPIYGLYRAPNAFTGESEVKITAKSRTEKQSITFTLKGASK